MSTTSRPTQITKQTLATRAGQLASSKRGHGEFQFPKFKNRAELFELFANPTTGPTLWLETCCTVKNIRGGGTTLLNPNRTQQAYADEVWNPGVSADLVPKPRKQGYSLWRIGLGLHALHYGPDGRIFRIVTHRDKTFATVMGFARQIHRSAWKFFENLQKELGSEYDPRYFMREVRTENTAGYTFSGESGLFIETASGSSVGQADRTDDAYLTEATSYEDFDVVFDGIQGSMPDGETRFTIDFNAIDGWMGTPIYPFLKQALLPHDDANWNGFHVFFRGIGDEPDLYTPERMARIEQRYKAIAPDRFRCIYPRTIDDLYQARAKNIHKRDEIEAAFNRVGGKYLLDELGGQIPLNIPVVQGVDTSDGLPDGDWQASSLFGLYDGIWWEICAPLYERVQEDIFGIDVADDHKKFGSLLVIERNKGAAVIIKCREEGVTNFFRHRLRDKSGKQKVEIGFWTSYVTKRQMIVDANRALREGTLGLVTAKTREEFSHVEWYAEGGLKREGAHTRDEIGGAPAVKGMNDDLWISALLAIQGIPQATMYRDAAQFKGH